MTGFVTLLLTGLGSENQLEKFLLESDKNGIFLSQLSEDDYHNILNNLNCWLEKAKLVISYMKLNVFCSNWINDISMSTNNNFYTPLDEQFAPILKNFINSLKDNNVLLKNSFPLKKRKRENLIGEEEGVLKKFKPNLTALTLKRLNILKKTSDYYIAESKQLNALNYSENQIDLILLGESTKRDLMTLERYHNQLINLSFTHDQITDLFKNCGAERRMVAVAMYTPALINQGFSLQEIVDLAQIKGGRYLLENLVTSYSDLCSQGITIAKIVETFKNVSVYKNNSLMKKLFNQAAKNSNIRETGQNSPRTNLFFNKNEMGYEEQNVVIVEEDIDYLQNI
ncbi:MAG: hypothetical protein Q8M40_12980 [Legionella sp.]|nr:hypothetical protein [Legionella sp.]